MTDGYPNFNPSTPLRNALPFLLTGSDYRMGPSKPISDPVISFSHPIYGEVTVEFDPQGLPVRHVITHGGRRAVGSIPSFRMGRTMPWESFAERALIQHLEFSEECKGYLVQPFIMEWSVLGINYKYFGDAIAEIDDRLVAYECKHIHPAVYGGRDSEKYTMVSNICRALEWGFEIVTTSQLTANPVKQFNYKDLQRNQFVSFGLAHELTVRDVLDANNGIMIFGLLVDRLAADFNLAQESAAAIIMAMAARRMVHIDLERRIDALSPVHLQPSPPGEMRLLNFWQREKGRG